MITQSTYQKHYLLFFILFVFSLISMVLIGSGSVTSSAESNEHPPKQTRDNLDRETAKDPSIGWITVDADEFNHIQNTVRNENGEFNLKVFEKLGAFVIVEADERQMLDLTRRMHEEFHKCGGFMWHETLAAARLSIAETSRVKTADKPAIVYTIDNQTTVNAMLGETQEPQIRETITRLSTDFPNRRHNQPSGLNSANWIKNKWTALAAGRGDITVEFYNHTADVTPQPSIIMTVPGTTLPNEVVVLGGHQDSINRNGATLDAPGADDDASGIATLTEVIRVMIAKNFRPQRTVKFMAYAAEEIGLRGSNEIAADFQNRGVNVVGVLQLDMTNYKNLNSPADIMLITDYTNFSQNQFIRDLITFYQPSVTFADSTCGYSCSDHASWTNRGYAASFPFESAPSNQTIHTTGDTLAQSGGNAFHALKFANLAVAYLGELAKGTQGTLSATYEADVQGRPIGDGFVDAADVEQIRLFSVGRGLPYQSNEFQRTDCSPRSSSGDGFVDSGDIQQARRYSVGIDAAQLSGGPNSVPPPLDFSSDDLFDSLIGSPNLRGLKMKRGGLPIVAAVRVDGQFTAAGQSLTVPIRVDAAGDEAGYTFSLNYDTAKLINPQVKIGTAGGDVVYNANTAGQIGFSVTSFSGGTIAAGTNQILVYVTFTTAAEAAGDTTLTFTDTQARRKTTGVDPNIPIPQPSYINGAVRIGSFKDFK